MNMEVIMNIAVLLAVGFALLAPMVMASPAGEAAKAEQVSIRFTTNHAPTHPIYPLQKEMVSRFQQKHPNVTIDFRDAEDIITLIKLEAANDRLPDMWTHLRMEPSFGLDVIVRAGKVADLTDWVSGSKVTSMFDQSSWNTASLDGRIRALPHYMFYANFAANTKLLADIGMSSPKSWDELVRSVKAFHAQGIIPWGIATGNNTQAGRVYNYVFNGTLTNERALRMHAGRETMDVADVRRAASLLDELVRGYLPVDSISLQGSAGDGIAYSKYINTRKAAYFFSLSYKAELTEEIKREIEPLLFPLIPGGAEKNAKVERDLTNLIYVASKSWADPKIRPYLEELLLAMVTVDYQKAVAEVARQPIARLGVDVDPAKVGTFAVKNMQVALSGAANKWLPSVMSPDARARYEPLLGEYLSGKFTPDAFVKELVGIFGK